MQVECLAIILVLLLMSYMISRAGKKEYGLALLPLVIVPLVHILSGLIGQVVANQISMPLEVVQVCIDVIGLVISCVVFSVLCTNIKNSKIRRTYLLLCSSFTVILTFVFIYDLLLVP